MSTLPPSVIDYNLVQTFWIIISIQTHEKAQILGDNIIPFSRYRPIKFWPQRGTLRLELAATFNFLTHIVR